MLIKKKNLRKTPGLRKNVEHTEFLPELFFASPVLDNANLRPLIHHNKVGFQLLNQSGSRFPWHLVELGNGYKFQVRLG